MKIRAQHRMVPQSAETHVARVPRAWNQAILQILGDHRSLSPARAVSLLLMGERGAPDDHTMSRRHKGVRDVHSSHGTGFACIHVQRLPGLQDPDCEGAHIPSVDLSVVRSPEGADELRCQSCSENRSVMSALIRVYPHWCDCIEVDRRPQACRFLRCSGSSCVITDLNAALQRVAEA